MTDYQVGDPVVDCAQGRPMIVLGVPDQTVAEWSDANGYDLQDNYANSKFDPADGEGVVRCAYVSDVRSEPSKDYTFPVSRVRLIDAHHADDGRRVADRVAVALLADVFTAMLEIPTVDGGEIDLLAEALDTDAELVDVARELADVEQTIPNDD